MLLATENEGGTVFHTTVTLNEIEEFQGIFNLAKQNLATEEVKTLSLATDNKGGMVFHSAAKR